MKPNLLLLLALGTAPLVHAEIDLTISAQIRLGKALPPPPPEVIVVEQVAPPGPPPWAPAHGFRRSHTYYYYPAAHVYFRPVDRVWFYLEGREWRFGASLPAPVHIDFERSVSLTMESDRPHQFHEKVVAYYPDNYFESKVRVKEKGGKPEKNDKDKVDHDDDSPGKSKGKGKGKNK